MRFEFATANRILYGPGTLREVAPLAKEMGRRAFVVCGQGTERVQPLLNALAEQGVAHTTFPVAGEPTTDLVLDGVRKAQAAQADVILGLGGGSVIDAGKAIAGLLTNPGELLDYLEVIGAGKALPNPALPYIAIPTTAGPGTEVTRNAVLASPAHRVKVSLRSPHLLPRLAVVDPELTYSLPPALTASTGLDALTQLIEPFLSIRANPVTDLICRDGITRVIRSLPQAFEGGTNLSARADLSLASLYGGLALANAGLGAVHGFASPIGGMFPAPHGAVCAALLPHVLAANWQALRQRSPNSISLQRLDEVAMLLTRHKKAKALDGITWLSDLSRSLQIPKLRAYGIGAQDIPVLCEKAAAASSMKANPINLTLEELRAVLNHAV